VFSRRVATQRTGPTVTRMAQCWLGRSKRFPPEISPSPTRRRFRHHRRRGRRSRHHPGQSRHRLYPNSRRHRDRWSLLRLVLSRGTLLAVAAVGAPTVAATAVVALAAVAVRRGRRRRHPCRRALSGSHPETGTEPLGVCAGARDKPVVTKRPRRGCPRRVQQAFAGFTAKPWRGCV